MSAQPTDQIGGTSPKPSLFRSLRGSFSQGTPVSAPVTSPITTSVAPATPGVEPTSTPVVPPPPAPPAPPAPAPVAPEEPIAEQLPPVELSEVAQEAAAPLSPPAENAQEPSAEVVTDDMLSSPLAAAVPTAVDSMTDTLNPPGAVGGSTAKETPLLSVTVEHPAIDQSGGVQYVEAERAHEMPPEVEGFIQKVEDNVDQIPQEIVISDVQTGQQLPRVLATPVVVLPITPETEDEGKHKSSAYSIRWLIEWSWKMMKMFSGKVIYRDNEG